MHSFEDYEMNVSDHPFLGDRQSQYIYQDKITRSWKTVHYQTHKALFVSTLSWGDCNGLLEHHEYMTRSPQANCNLYWKGENLQPCQQKVLLDI
ncbi:unnamed protein product [Schistosoma margrebowiei]|uniref:Uncharacterized protein n=1 Tax=Schistosoma margrebowiei TaxID=48269 RepID=A0A3P7ZUH9_9TREM|nr:unnamed protein product [Schistosoma margrebowiei]